MAERKLGEILVEGRLLGPSELKKALDAQLIFGGRLGTNLLELGLLSEEQLAEALHDQTQSQVATEAMLAKASDQALARVPAKVAGRHFVVPFALKDKKLHVAVLDPTDLIVLDELAFVSGCQVVPFVAPEVRLLTYLEKHYDVSRPIRYVKLARPAARPSALLDDQSLAAEFTPGQIDLERREGPAVPTPPVTAAPEVKRPEDVAPVGERVLSISELLELDDATAVADKMEEVGAGALNAVETASDEQRVQMEAALDELKRRREDESLQPDESAAIQSFEDAAALLAEADTREEIGEVLVGLARLQFPRVMAYVVQRDRALGWLAAMPGRTPDQGRTHARRILVPLGEPSVLQGVVTSGQYYMGELSARPGDEALAAALGRPRPSSVVILPVKLNEKVVLLLQGDGLDQPLTGFDMRSLRAGCQKAALAMEVLLLRSRIRQVS